MPHTPEHTVSNTAQYKIYGTDEPYNGMTVEIGGFMYSTVGGALEGKSYQLTPMGSNTTVDRVSPPTPPGQGMGTPNTGNNRNPDNRRALVTSGTEGTGGGNMGGRGRTIFALLVKFL